MSETHPQSLSHPHTYPYVIAIGLVVLTLVTFWPLRTADFTHLDDPLYVTENPMVLAGWTGEGLRWAFTEFYAGFWTPILWMSFMLDIELFGPDAGAFHMVNIAFHTLNILLLFVLLYQITGGLWRSAITAALFAIHPLRVESVAWIVERKDVLSLFFGLLATLTYVQYIRRPRVLSYVLTLLCFALGLMAKSMLVTLPCILLLLDYWPLGRWRKGQIRRLIREKIPMLALSAVSSVLTFLAHRQFGGIQGTMDLPMFTRLWNALVACMWYLAKLWWPTNLAFFYPYPDRPYSLLLIAGAGAILLGISLLALKNMRRRPYLLTGWLWYLGTLVPVIGIVQVGMQAWADRFTYLPMIGITIMIVWLAADLADRGHIRLLVRGVVVFTVLAVLFPLTRAQMATWQNTVTLARHALRVTGDNFLAETLLGNSLEQSGNDAEAIKQYKRAVQANPEYFIPYSRLGVLMEKNGRPDEAVGYYARALQLNPNLPGIKLLLGRRLQYQGQVKQALELYRDVLRFNPLDPNAHYISGTAYEALGDFDTALSHYRQAAQLDRVYATARDRLILRRIQDFAQPEQAPSDTGKGSEGARKIEQ